MGIRTARLRRYGFFIPACAALALLASPAFALGGPLGPDVVVRYKDLDLDTTKGANRLLKRIRLAAGSICEPLYKGTAFSRRERDQCVLQLTGETVAKVNRPLVLAAHESSLHRNKPKVALPG